MGMYDHARRRQSIRGQRRKGCLIYLPAEELERAGIDPNGPPPTYRTWGAPRGSVLIRLYRQTQEEYERRKGDDDEGD